MQIFVEGIEIITLGHCDNFSGERRKRNDCLVFSFFKDNLDFTRILLIKLKFIIVNINLFTFLIFDTKGESQFAEEIAWLRRISWQMRKWYRGNMKQRFVSFYATI